MKRQALRVAFTQIVANKKLRCQLWLAQLQSLRAAVSDNTHVEEGLCLAEVMRLERLPKFCLEGVDKGHAVRCDEDVVDVDQNLCAALLVVLDEQSGFSLGGGITENSQLVAQPLVPSTGSVLQAVECAVNTIRVADRCHGKPWWLLNPDLLFQMAVQKTCLDVQLMQLKVSRCHQCQQRTQCGVCADRSVDFVKVNAFPLVESFRNRSGFEALSMTCCICFDCKDSL